MRLTRIPENKNGGHRLMSRLMSLVDTIPPLGLSLRWRYVQSGE
jgi:hypothetical protein